MQLLPEKIQAQKDKVSAYDDEIKRLSDKIKKEPKSAASSKKQIGEVNVMKQEANEALTQLNTEKTQQAASAVNTEEVTKKSDNAKVGLSVLATSPIRITTIFLLGMMYIF